MPTFSVGNRPSRSAAPAPVPDRSRGRKGAAGVTLVEMLVTVAIIGLIAGISAPSISAGLDSIRLVSAADDVSSFLNTAVNRAVRRQEAVELVLSAKDNRIRIYSTDPGFFRELRFPDGVSLELPGQSDDVRLIIMPADTVPGIGIQIANRRGSRRIVRLDPMTGFPRVESVKAE